MKSLGLLLLRVMTGGLMALHGYPKLFGGPNKQVSPQAEQILGQGFTQSLQGGGFNNFAGMVQSMQLPAPKALAGAAAGAEFFGSLALILGWRTRLAALLLIADMLVAIRKVHWNNGILGQGGYENNLLYLGGLITLLVAGPGKISLDRG